MSKLNQIENNNELQTMFLSSYDFLLLSRNERIKSMVPRPKKNEAWYCEIRTSGVGKFCPTCDVRMRRPKYDSDPNSVTVEHIVPLSLGGDNKKNGQFPNCIPMCRACNQARNKVVMEFGKGIGVVKFLIEQVYCKGVRLAEKFLCAFKRFVRREKNRKVKKKREHAAVLSSQKAVCYEPMTVKQASKFDLSHRSSVIALSQCFDQVWRDEKAVHESQVHASVRDGWFPVIEGRGRVQYRSKKKVKMWMKKYLSGQISKNIFLTSFMSTEYVSKAKEVNI